MSPPLTPWGGAASGKPFGSAVVVVVVVIGVVLVVVGYVVGTRELGGERGRVRGKGWGSVERGVPPPQRDYWGRRGRPS